MKIISAMANSVVRTSLLTPSKSGAAVSLSRRALIPVIAWAIAFVQRPSFGSLSEANYLIVKSICQRESERRELKNEGLFHGQRTGQRNLKLSLRRFTGGFGLRESL